MILMWCWPQSALSVRAVYLRGSKKWLSRGISKTTEINHGENICPPGSRAWRVINDLVTGRFIVAIPNRPGPWLGRIVWLSVCGAKLVRRYFTC